MHNVHYNLNALCPNAFWKGLLNGFDHKARVLILVEEFSGWPSSSLSTKSTTNTTHVCPAFRTNFRPDTAAWAVLEVKTYDSVEIVRTTRAKHLTYNKELNIIC